MRHRELIYGGSLAVSLHPQDAKGIMLQLKDATNGNVATVTLTNHESIQLMEQLSERNFALSAKVAEVLR